MVGSDPLPWPLCLCAETLDADSIIGASVPRSRSVDTGPDRRGPACSVPVGSRPEGPEGLCDSEGPKGTCGPEGSSSGLSGSSCGPSGPSDTKVES